MKKIKIFLGTKILLLTLLTTNVRAQDYGFAIDQLQILPPYMGTFIGEYMRDINENLNNQFFFASQTSAAALKKGEWEISVLGGGSLITSQEINQPDQRDYPHGQQIFISGEVPTIFGPSQPSSLTFQFKDPDSGQPLTNPFDGTNIEFSLDLPSGLGLGLGATPSAALSLGYGIGYGTEVKAYFTPMLLSILGETEDGFSFNGDQAWGFQLKHEISHWIPKMKEKGYHMSISGGYSSYNLAIESSFLDAPIEIALSDSVSIFASDNISGIVYDISTYGGKFTIGKSFKYMEFAAFVDYTENSFSMASEGGLIVDLIDKTGDTPNETSNINGLMDYEGTNSQMGYGASLTIGQKLFRTSLSYRRANTNFFAIGIQFHFGGKKDAPSPKEAKDQ
tara:strand:- start:42234 stop:43412 length:1179 start_codon:yes stop_codon:yes gene_type:complete